MRNTIYTLLLSLSLLTLFTTCKNPEIDHNTFSITEENIQPGLHGVKASGKYAFLGEVMSMKLNIGLDEQLADAESHPMNLDNQNFSITIDSLTPGTLFHYCYVVEFNDSHKLVTEIGEFTTLSDKPLVRTLEKTTVDPITVSVKCIVDDDCGMAITERGICWNTSGAPNLNDNKIKHDENAVGEYVCLMGNLQPNKTYFVRAYAKNNKGVGLAEKVLQFDTPLNPNDSLTIVTYCNPTSAGTATGGGLFAYGESCTVHAEATAYYTFVNWTENGIPVSSETDYSFDVISNRTLVANFTEKAFIISVEIQPEEGGTATGMGPFDNGENCTLTASPNNNYEFNEWTKNGEHISNNTSISFTVTESATYIAHFRPKTFHISVSANPDLGGTVSGEGDYTYGTNCTVTATANNGYVFINWTENENVVSTQESYSFNVNNDKALVANFEQTYPVGAINGHFTINSDGDQVYFSQGNLQYIGSAGNGDDNNTGAYWKFAEHQWDYLGDNGQGSSNKQVDRDLFGWGTSGYRHGANAFQPWNTSSEYDDYQAYGIWNKNLGDEDSKADWGYNAISNGGNTENSGWRTLTTGEWEYVLNKRRASGVNGTLNARYAKAIVNNVSGLILFPDVYTHPDEIPLQNINAPNAPFSTNVYNDDESWSVMEIHGCVFLPITGSRSGISVSLDTGGCYWSSSYCNDSRSFRLNFNDDDLSVRSFTRYTGQSVRLVYPVE